MATAASPSVDQPGPSSWFQPRMPGRTFASVEVPQVPSGRHRVARPIAAVGTRATGEHPRSRTAQRSDTLTAQELGIARLVATWSTLMPAMVTTGGHLRGFHRCEAGKQLRR